MTKKRLSQTTSSQNNVNTSQWARKINYTDWPGYLGFKQEKLYTLKWQLLKFRHNKCFIRDFQKNVCLVINNAKRRNYSEMQTILQKCIENQTILILIQRKNLLITTVTQC